MTEFDLKVWDAARATAPHFCHGCDRVLSLREAVEQAGVCDDCYREDRRGWRPGPTLKDSGQEDER